MSARIATALLAITAILPVSVVAQAVPEVGDRVQVRTQSGHRAIGTVSFLSADALEVVDGSNRTRVFEMNAIRGLRVARLVEAQPGAGTRRGMKVFVATTAVFAGAGAVTWKPCRATGLFACFMHPNTRGDAALWGAAIGAVLALPAALIVGLTTGSSEEWEDAVVPTGGLGAALAATRTFPGVTPGSVGVGLSIPVGR